MAIPTDSVNIREVLKLRGLSDREAEVAEVIAKGNRSKIAAETLFVSEKTIKYHLTNIYKKTGFRSRYELIIWAQPYLAKDS